MAATTSAAKPPKLLYNALYTAMLEKIGKYLVATVSE